MCSCANLAGVCARRGIREINARARVCARNFKYLPITNTVSNKNVLQYILRKIVYYYVRIYTNYHVRTTLSLYIYIHTIRVRNNNNDNNECFWHGKRRTISFYLYVLSDLTRTLV